MHFVSSLIQDLKERFNLSPQEVDDLIRKMDEWGRDPNLFEPVLPVNEETDEPS
jgi:hypothetical protein